MTRNDLASAIAASPDDLPAVDADAAPAEPQAIDADAPLIERLAIAVEALVRQTQDPELRCYPAAEVAEILGKTENWVVEAMQDRRVPFTYIGKSPRMTAAHIRWVLANGELMPHRYSAAAA